MLLHPDVAEDSHGSSLEVPQMKRDCLFKLRSAETQTSILRNIIPLYYRSALISILNLYPGRFCWACLLFLSFAFSSNISWTVFLWPSELLLWSWFVKCEQFFSDTTEEERHESLGLYEICPMHWSFEPLHGSVLEWVYIFGKNISSGSECAGLPHWPVCLVESDEFGNEKQVCVCEMCGSLLYLTLFPPFSWPFWVSRVELFFMTKGVNGGGWAEKTQKGWGQSVSISKTQLQILLFVLLKQLFCPSSIEHSDMNVLVNQQLPTAN